MKTVTLYYWELVKGRKILENGIARSENDADELREVLLENNREAKVRIQPVEITGYDITRLGATLMGSQSSERKAASSRENGKKGGRPRKRPVTE